MNLSLRPVTPADAELLHLQLGCDPIMWRYTGWNPYATLESSQEFVARNAANHGTGSYSWVIEDGGMPVGIVGAYGLDRATMQAELGYSVFAPQWGKGYAKQAARLALEQLFNAGLTKVSAWTATDNIASAKVLEACGMHLVETTPGDIEVDGQIHDKACYAITREEWAAR